VTTGHSGEAGVSGMTSRSVWRQAKGGGRLKTRYDVACAASGGVACIFSYANGMARTLSVIFISKARAAVAAAFLFGASTCAWLTVPSIQSISGRDLTAGTYT